MKTLIVGLGNPIAGDDVVGILVARKVYETAKSYDMEYCEASYGGWRLGDVLAGYERVIIIDSIQNEDQPVGECSRIEQPDQMPIRLQSSHGFGLIESIELSKIVYQMSERPISIYGINIKKPQEYTDKISGELVRKIPEITKQILLEEFAMAY